jgi:hypothetical protein
VLLLCADRRDHEPVCCIGHREWLMACVNRLDEGTCKEALHHLRGRSVPEDFGIAWLRAPGHAPEEMRSGPVTMRCHRLPAGGDGLGLGAKPALALSGIMWIRAYQGLQGRW